MTGCHMPLTHAKALGACSNRSCKGSLARGLCAYRCLVSIISNQINGVAHATGPATASSSSSSRFQTTSSIAESIGHAGAPIAGVELSCSRDPTREDNERCVCVRGWALEIWRGTLLLDTVDTVCGQGKSARKRRDRITQHNERPCQFQCHFYMTEQPQPAHRQPSTLRATHQEPNGP